MNDTQGLGNSQKEEEKNLGNTSREDLKLIAAKAIVMMRYGIHLSPLPAMTDAQHRMIRSLFGAVLGSRQNLKIKTSAYGDSEEEKSLAVEMLGTITGDNGRTAVRGVSKHAASVIIGELADVESKRISDRGRNIITGLTYVIEDYPIFEERNDYIERVASDLCNLQTAYHGRTRDARSDRDTRERARQLLARRSNHG